MSESVRIFVIADEASQFTALTGHGWRGEREALIFRSLSWSRAGPEVAEMVVPADEVKRLAEWLLAWHRETEPKK